MIKNRSFLPEKYRKIGKIDKREQQQHKFPVYWTSVLFCWISIWLKTSTESSCTRRCRWLRSFRRTFPHHPMGSFEIFMKIIQQQKRREQESCWNWVDGEESPTLNSLLIYKTGRLHQTAHRAGPVRIHQTAQTRLGTFVHVQTCSISSKIHAWWHLLPLDLHFHLHKSAKREQNEGWVKTFLVFSIVEATARIKLF